MTRDAAREREEPSGPAPLVLVGDLTAAACADDGCLLPGAAAEPGDDTKPSARP